MSLMDDFRQALNEIQAAVNDANEELAQSMEYYAKESARTRVYSYKASPAAMKKRRYALTDGANYTHHLQGAKVSVKNETELREHEGTLEVPWIEEGTEQGPAGARPFMEEGLQEFVASGDGDRILAQHLSAAGFQVQSDAGIF
jgi:hypothetical protein